MQSQLSTQAKFYCITGGGKEVSGPFNIEVAMRELRKHNRGIIIDSDMVIYEVRALSTERFWPSIAVIDVYNASIRRRLNAPALVA